MSEEILNCQKRYLVHTYTADLVLARGKNARVWDLEGHEYLDFTSGISVCNLGHCHPAVTEAICEQAETLVHISNLFVNTRQPLLAKAIADHSFNGRVFFCNSGAEANEGMIKFARKWGKAKGRYKIICMEHSFHGRTLGTLAATDKPAIREDFEPLPDGFKFVPFNDIEAVAAAIDDQTAAVMLEPVQGEGGVIPATKEYMQQLRELCDRQGILMLLDEVQTGFGRTGMLFGYQNYAIEPDAMSMAKGIANGFPMGAFEVASKWKDVLTPGSHATTFGGTPLACAAALAVLNTIERDNLLETVRQDGAYLLSQLRGLAGRYPSLIQEVRGIGLMIGLQMSSEEAQKALIANARGKGLLLMGAAQHVVRVYPPFTISRNELDEGIQIIEQSLGEINHE
ncbi:MAG: aspartate aminotransferase family protein [Lentisphaerae bacterium]|nr:MAG: aspartate aminotransferase family protein [Lentisphaerota bacterium]